MANKKPQIDFYEVGRAVSLERVLDRLGVLAIPKGGGKKRRRTNSDQFHIDLEIGVWHCFGNCNRGGDSIGLVAGIDTTPTFAEVAAMVHTQRLTIWSSGKHVEQWIKTLQEYAYPQVGQKRTVVRRS